MQAEKPGKVSRNEWLLVLGIAAGIMILTVLPYARAVQMAGPGEYFCGFLWGVDEGNVYLAWLRQVTEILDLPADHAPLLVIPVGYPT